MDREVVVSDVDPETDAEPVPHNQHATRAARQVGRQMQPPAAAAEGEMAKATKKKKKRPGKRKRKSKDRRRRERHEPT